MASDIFAAAMARTVGVAMSVLVVVALLATWLAVGHLAATVTIALASIFISVASLMPGVMSRVPRGVGELNASAKLNSQLFLLGVTVAMGVRFAGTVALFVACRYQFGLTEGAVAFHVCGWYAALTSLEIFFLAHGASAIDSVVQTGGVEVSDGPKPVSVAADSFCCSQPPLTDSTIG